MLIGRSVWNLDVFPVSLNAVSDRLDLGGHHFTFSSHSLRKSHPIRSGSTDLSLGNLVQRGPFRIG